MATAKATPPRIPATACPEPWMTPELIADTLRTWQPRSREPLTEADAVEILRNVGRLFGCLLGDAP